MGSEGRPRSRLWRCLTSSSVSLDSAVEALGGLATRPQTRSPEKMEPGALDLITPCIAMSAVLIACSTSEQSTTVMLWPTWLPMSVKCGDASYCRIWVQRSGLGCNLIKPPSRRESCKARLSPIHGSQVHDKCLKA